MCVYVIFVKWARSRLSVGARRSKISNSGEFRDFESIRMDWVSGEMKNCGYFCEIRLKMDCGRCKIFFKLNLNVDSNSKEHVLLSVILVLFNIERWKIFLLFNIKK